jgi:hypothetical protein
MKLTRGVPFGGFRKLPKLHRIDETVSSELPEIKVRLQNLWPPVVIPAQAGIRNSAKFLDSGSR